MRYVEVKGHVATGDVILYYTEWQMANRMREEYFIYQVMNALVQPELWMVQRAIRRRFASGLRNFFTLYQRVVDTWQLFDNSDVTGPRLVASGRTGRQAEVANEDDWKNIVERQQ
ncbi:MAG: DUF3883 domain-containing protein [Chloroflexi bacterium]|nr:DUF3883 domain-containing protein [Chloroflexota bacterium]